MAEGYYLYGVVEASARKSWGAVGLENQKVSAISFRDIAALANPWASGVTPATPENCLAHERVLNDVIKQDTILPFEFGTIAPDIEAVNALLRGNYARFRRVLAKLKGNVEVNVTALWHDMKAVLEEIVKAHPMIATYKREIMNTPYEQTYRDRLKIGQIVAEAVEAKKRLEGDKLYNALRKNTAGACQTRAGNVSSDRAIFTAAFLLNRRAYSDFERRLQELVSRYDGRIDFKYTDALPPYHFIDLKVTV